MGVNTFTRRYLLFTRGVNLMIKNDVWWDAYEEGYQDALKDKKHKKALEKH